MRLHFHELWTWYFYCLKVLGLLHRFSRHWLRRQVNVMSAGSSLSIVFFPIARLLIVFLWISTVSYCKTGIPVASHLDILWPGAGLHKLWYPGIRDMSTWSKFGAHGEHGDVFLFSNLGALCFSENLIRHKLHICLRFVKNNFFSFKHPYLRHFPWRF